jgi:hypothetical protein
LWVFSKKRKVKVKKQKTLQNVDEDGGGVNGQITEEAKK